MSNAPPHSRRCHKVFLWRPSLSLVGLSVSQTRKEHPVSSYPLLRPRACTQHNAPALCPQSSVIGDILFPADTIHSQFTLPCLGSDRNPKDVLRFTSVTGIWYFPRRSSSKLCSYHENVIMRMRVLTYPASVMETTVVWRASSPAGTAITHG